MALFGFGKKKDKGNEKGCCCGGKCDAEKMKEAKGALEMGARIKVLGSGCAKCKELEENTKAALVELGMEPTLDHVTDFAQIATYGVMTTPALVVDDKVVSNGKVLKKEEVIKLLKEVLQ